MRTPQPLRDAAHVAAADCALPFSLSRSRCSRSEVMSAPNRAGTAGSGRTPARLAVTLGRTRAIRSAEPNLHVPPSFSTSIEGIEPGRSSSSRAGSSLRASRVENGPPGGALSRGVARRLRGYRQRSVYEQVVEPCLVRRHERARARGPQRAAQPGPRKGQAARLARIPGRPDPVVLHVGKGCSKRKSWLGQRHQPAKFERIYRGRSRT
ncbi:MAG: hypothetical protein RL685_3730 [Pseudomonadota bacterium]|jgi:hypothetical protein